MRHLRFVVACAALVLTLLLTIATALGSLLPQWWVGELLSHPRVQYAVGLALCFPPLLLWFRRVAWLLVVPLLVNVAAFAPLYLPAPSAAPAITRPFSVLHYNLDMTVPDHTAAFAYLRANPTDILLLQELTPALDQQLASQLPDYRVVYTRPLENTHGSALLLPRTSDVRVVNVGEIHLPTYSPRPMITATLELAGQQILLLSMQVVRPKDAYTEDIQQTEYAEIARWSRAQQRQHPVLIIGDCNTTPWSARFQTLLRDGQLRDSSQGFGPQPTWPAFIPPALGIPIDHGFYSSGIAIVDRHAGPALGGDHTPLFVRFVVTSV